MDGSVHRIFDNETEDLNNVFSPGTLSTFPSYTATETGNYSADVLLPFTITQDDITSNTATWSLLIYKKAVNGTKTLLDSHTQTFSAGNPSTATLTFSGYEGGYLRFALSEPLQGFNITISSVTILGYPLSSNCNVSSPYNAKLEGSNVLTITAGSYNGSKFVTNNFPTYAGYDYQSPTNVTVNGTQRQHNSQFNIGSTLVTLNLNPGCQSAYF